MNRWSFPCYFPVISCFSLFLIQQFRRMSLLVLIFLQVLAVTPPPFTGIYRQGEMVSAPNTDNGLSNLLWHEADVFGNREEDHTWTVSSIRRDASAGGEDVAEMTT